ncbi:hypothetical protein U1Q18_017136 [Sarracenia purpurea var. burkii]
MEELGLIMRWGDENLMVQWVKKMRQNLREFDGAMGKENASKLADELLIDDESAIDNENWEEDKIENPIEFDH